MKICYNATTLSVSLRNSWQPCHGFSRRSVDERTDEDLKDLYRQYVGSYDVLRNLSFDEILVYASDQWTAAERISRLDMLAELFFAEGSYKNAPLRDMLLTKAYKLFDYVEAHGTVYSLSRRKKMQQIADMNLSPSDAAAEKKGPADGRH